MSYTYVNLNEEDSLEFDIFIDRSVMEIFANNKECFIQRFYPETFDGLYLKVFKEKETEQNPMVAVKYWEMNCLNIEKEHSVGLHI